MTRTIVCEVDGCGGSGRGGEPGLAVDGLRVCRACRRGFTADLHTAPGLYRACERVLTNSPRPQEKVSGRPAYGIALNSAAVEARARLAGVLASWCDLVVAERACAAPPRSVDEHARFLIRHADWLCAHAAVGDAVAEVAELTRAAHRVAYPSWTRKLRVGSCVEPGCGGSLMAFLRFDQQLPSEVVCDADEDHTWPAHLWQELDRRVHDRKRTDRWLSAADVASLWSLSTSNVYRLASEDEWRRRTVGRRVFYHEADVVLSVSRSRTGRR